MSGGMDLDPRLLRPRWRRVERAALTAALLLAAAAWWLS